MVVFAAYTVCRWLYFGAVLTEPLATKVLYKLQLDGHLVAKGHVRNYAARFLDEYGWITPMAVVGAALLTARDRWTVRLLSTMLLLVGYNAIVGDWMYGFRFFVSVLPLYAILIGVVVSRLGRAIPPQVPRSPPCCSGRLRFLECRSRGPTRRNSSARAG